MNFRFIKIAYEKLSETKQKPKIVLQGEWVRKAGFEMDSLVLAEFRKGIAVFKIPDKDGGETTLLHQIKQKEIQLLKVGSTLSKGKTRPSIQAGYSLLAELGFSIGSLVIVMVEYGIIQVKVLDVDMLESLFYPSKQD